MTLYLAAREVQRAAVRRAARGERRSGERAPRRLHPAHSGGATVSRDGRRGLLLCRLRRRSCVVSLLDPGSRFT